MIGSAAGAAHRRLLSAVLQSRCLPCWHAPAARQCTSRGSSCVVGCPAAINTPNLWVCQAAAQHTTSEDTASPSNVQMIEDKMGPLSKQPMAPPPQPHVIIISGPSGVGKDAVIQRLRELRPDLYFVVTATSRAMRSGEVEGKDYFFVSKQQFEAWIEEGQLLEHARVYGEYKGIPRQQVDEALARGTDVVLRIDVQGAATVRKHMPGVISIFIVAESEAALVSRLVARKTEAPEKLLVRVQTAKGEVSTGMHEFDYVVVNKDGQMDDCVKQIETILDAEKLRVQHSS